LRRIVPEDDQTTLRYEVVLDWNTGRYGIPGQRHSPLDEQTTTRGVAAGLIFHTEDHDRAASDAGEPGAADQHTVAPCVRRLHARSVH
jgi:hypothetical protein